MCFVGYTNPIVVLWLCLDQQSITKIAQNFDHCRTYAIPTQYYRIFCSIEWIRGLVNGSKPAFSDSSGLRFALFTVERQEALWRVWQLPLEMTELRTGVHDAFYGCAFDGFLRGNFSSRTIGYLAG
jgi:hypothetical protein